MTTNKLAKIMASKGYSFKCNQPGIYSYTYRGWNDQISQRFTGNWAAFVKFCDDLPNMRAQVVG